jgi:hypothetical protein
MKISPRLSVLILSAALAASSAADEAPAEDLANKHLEGSAKVADDQDELAADVQQLVLEQTVQEVIDLLNEARDIMNEATDLLAEGETGGVTIAAQTEIIEKIHAAAKERQKQQGSGQAGGAMMDMMERMMGKQPGGDQPGEGEGEGENPGDSAGQGQEGDSDTANTGAGAASGTHHEQRRIPKAAGTAGRSLPNEFQKALDAYNRGAESQPK